MFMWNENDAAGVGIKKNVGNSFSLRLFTPSPCWLMVLSSTVKPVLRDHCHEKPPVLTDHAFLAEGPTFRYNLTCHQRPPVLTDHIFVANGVVFPDRFYCNHLL